MGRQRFSKYEIAVLLLFRQPDGVSASRRPRQAPRKVFKHAVWRRERKSVPGADHVAPQRQAALRLAVLPEKRGVFHFRPALFEKFHNGRHGLQSRTGIWPRRLRRRLRQCAPHDRRFCRTGRFGALIDYDSGRFLCNLRIFSPRFATCRRFRRRIRSRRRLPRSGALPRRSALPPARPDSAPTARRCRRCPRPAPVVRRRL